MKKERAVELLAKMVNGIFGDEIREIIKMIQDKPELHVVIGHVEGESAGDDVLGIYLTQYSADKCAVEYSINDTLPRYDSYHTERHVLEE